jgi:hypothetical protein
MEEKGEWDFRLNGPEQNRNVGEGWVSLVGKKSKKIGGQITGTR